jgi:hypothetical protein
LCNPGRVLPSSPVVEGSQVSSVDRVAHFDVYESAIAVEGGFLSGW